MALSWMYRFPSFYWCVESSTRIQRRQWGKSLSTFHCFMRKQNTKIHTDFELSVCRLHQSVFISLYNMQRWDIGCTPLSPPRSNSSQMLSNYCPICFCCIFGTVSVVVSVSTLCHHKAHLSFVHAQKRSTWTTGTSLWSTMKNKMTRAQELEYKWNELFFFAGVRILIICFPSIHLYGSGMWIEPLLLVMVTVLHNSHMALFSWSVLTACPWLMHFFPPRPGHSEYHL